MRNPPSGEIHTPSRNTCTTFSWRKHTAHEVCVLKNTSGHTCWTEQIQSWKIWLSPLCKSLQAICCSSIFWIRRSSAAGRTVQWVCDQNRTWRESATCVYHLWWCSSHQTTWQRKKAGFRNPISILIYRVYLSLTCPEFEGRCCTRGGRWGHKVMLLS